MQEREGGWERKGKRETEIALQIGKVSATYFYNAYT